MWGELGSVTKESGALFLIEKSMIMLLLLYADNSDCQTMVSLLILSKYSLTIGMQILKLCCSMLELRVEFTSFK